MPGQSIIIIGSSGGTRTTIQPGISYTLLAGEGVKNTAASGVAHVIFRQTGYPAADWYIGPDETMTSMTDGTVELA